MVEGVTSKGQSADAALAEFDGSPERSAVRAISLGTLRWYLRLMPALAGLISRPGGLDGSVRALLAVTAHQIEYSRNPAETTVHAAVDAARILEAAPATGLVNAVLRRFVLERGTLLDRVDAELTGRTAHPGWLVERILAAWPQEHAALLAANNAHPPMTLRVDRSRATVADYRALLERASIDSIEVQWMPSALTLTQPVAIADLPGFRDGLVSVQDAGAQLAAKLLAAEPGMHVLDACAAPGGKTGHLLEELGERADVTAVDIDARRAELIRENLVRLKRSARVAVADLREPERFWDGRAFERILLDVPCSASGVIRRHPDIKLLRRAGDLPALAAAQVEILRSAARLLAPGGRLVYSTCSVLPEENEEVVRRVAASEPGVVVAQMPAAATLAPGARDRSPGVQLLPGAEAGTDGFYYACLEKTTTGT